jgi:tetratricopeptide (TPR) repeat protein
MAAIEVPEGTTRPESGVQSRSFAGLAYRLLLRAWIGTQQIEQALETMGQLEKVGGDDILSAYTQLGMELQDELKRLQAAGEQERLAQVRTSFEQFLQKVYESRNKSDYNSLLWIGETYYGLGLGVTDDKVGAEGYFEKAGNAYSEILAERLVSEDGRNAVLLRLARCRRRQQEFPEALKQVEEILAANAMNLDAQFEAALILGDWGEASEPERLSQSIQGIRDASGKPTSVWGWGALSKRLQQIVMKDPGSEFRPRFFDARYELSQSRRRIARVTSDKAAATAQLKSALAELSSVAQAFREMDDVNFARFDRLYQDIQKDLGESPAPLVRNSVAEAKPSAADVTPDEPAEPTVVSTAAAPAATEQRPSGTSGILFSVVIVAVSLAVAGGLFVMMRKPRQRVRVPGNSGATKLKLDVPESSGFGLPDQLDIPTPELGDFSVLDGLAIPGGRAMKSKAPGVTGRPQPGPGTSTPSAERAVGGTVAGAGPGGRPSSPGTPTRSRPPITPSPTSDTARGESGGGKKGRPTEAPPE